MLTSARLDATGHRWLAELSLYDFQIYYRSGKQNTDADALSRLPGSVPDSYRAVDKQLVTAMCEAVSVQEHGCVASMMVTGTALLDEPKQHNCGTPYVD